MSATTTAPHLHAVPAEASMRNAAYDHPRDRVDARLAQAAAIVSFIRADDAGNGGEATLADWVTKDALWAVSDLLEDAQVAAQAAERAGHE